MSDLIQTQFEYEDIEETEAEWDLIAESMHIAFMQQEAVRFQVSELSEFADEFTVKEEASQKSFEYSDAEDGREDTND